MRARGGTLVTNLGYDSNKILATKQLFITPWFCALLFICFFVFWRTTSNLSMSSSPPALTHDLAFLNKVAAKPKTRSHGGGAKVIKTVVQSTTRTKEKTTEVDTKVAKDLAQVKRDLKDESRALGRGDFLEYNTLEKKIGDRLKKVEVSLHKSKHVTSLSTQLGALEAEKRMLEHQANDLSSHNTMAKDAKARQRVTQIVRSEELIMKKGKEAMEQAKHASEQEEKLLKEENDLVKQGQRAFKMGDYARAKKYAADAEKLEKKEEEAEREAKAAGARAHELEREGLRQSRKEWENVDGAAFPELGHQHAKAEDSRMNLKHREADFEVRQKHDEEKHKKTANELTELNKRILGGHSDVNSAV
jgi:hypothetical protein